MAEIPRLTRGKLCLLRTSKSGRGFYNLQYWHGGRNNVKYVSDEQYDFYAEAIDGYARFIPVPLVDNAEHFGIDPVTRLRTAAYIDLQG